LTSKEKLFKIKSFCVYYGRGRSEELSQFDLVVVEPLGHDVEDIKQIQKSGTLVIAYLSVMEILSGSEQFKILVENDFLNINGKRIKNKEYGTFIIDIRSKSWNLILEHTINHFIYHIGYDGIFLDTIGDVEWSEIPNEYRDSVLLAAVNFVQRTRIQFPESIIIQNNGLVELCQLTSPYLDGLCWENPSSSSREDLKWSKIVAKKLKFLKKKEKLTIFLLIENTSQSRSGFVLKLARKNRFLTYLAPIQYTQNIIPPQI